jgi:twitching motility protein PilU
MDHRPIAELLDAMLKAKASDMYLTFGAAPALRVENAIIPIETPALSDEAIEEYLIALLSAEQREEFEATLEFNTALDWQGITRLRLNVFRQQQHNGLVIRRVSNKIPTLESLQLPAAYGELILEKRGLVLVTGPTGSGKTTSLAAMVGHRNRFGSGHIVTIEDPIEFVHAHGKCIVTQRDVGLDTYSYGMALKNALRQRPDVIVIGEIRDRETMEHAISFAETGHLCVATLHANNANQTLERILNFFPEDKHAHLLANLALNLHGVLSQRLVPTKDGKVRALAVEVMRNRGLIKQLIEEGKIRQIKEMIERGATDGMCSMDQSLMALVKQGIVDVDVAIAEADSPANMRLLLRQEYGSSELNVSRIMRAATRFDDDDKY